MKKNIWLYKTVIIYDPNIYINSENIECVLTDSHLNKLGEDGWELIQITPMPNLKYSKCFFRKEVKMNINS